MNAERAGSDSRPAHPIIRDDDHRHPTTAEREARDRVHAVCVVLQAVDAGEWELDVDVIDGAVALLGLAARWALVAELERAAA